MGPATRARINAAGIQKSYVALTDRALDAYRERVEKDNAEQAAFYLNQAEKLRRILDNLFGVHDVRIERSSGGFPIATLGQLRAWASFTPSDILLVSWRCRRCDRSHVGSQVVTDLADLGEVVAKGVRQEDSCRGL